MGIVEFVGKQRLAFVDFSWIRLGLESHYYSMMLHCYPLHSNLRNPSIQHLKILLSLDGRNGFLSNGGSVGGDGGSGRRHESSGYGEGSLEFSRRGFAEEMDEEDFGVVQSFERENSLDEEGLRVLHVEMHEPHLRMRSSRERSERFLVESNSGKRVGVGAGLTMAIPMRSPRTALEVSPRS